MENVDETHVWIVHTNPSSSFKCFILKKQYPFPYGHIFREMTSTAESEKNLSYAGLDLDILSKLANASSSLFAFYDYATKIDSMNWKHSFMDPITGQFHSTVDIVSCDTRFQPRIALKLAEDHERFASLFYLYLEKEMELFAIHGKMRIKASTLPSFSIALNGKFIMI